MKRRAKHWLVSRTLTTGVLVSFALLVAGLIESYFLPRGAAGTGSASDVLPGVLEGDATATVTAGLMVLMLTPLLRVIVLTFDFIRAREISFAIISIGVLFLLAVTVAFSFG